MLRRNPTIAMRHTFFGLALQSRCYSSTADDNSMIISEELLELKRCKLTFNNGETLIISQQSTGKGRFADIYPVFESATSTQPESCVKVAREQEDMLDISRELSMLTLMGRHARLFRMDGLNAMFTDWQPGVPLHKLAKSEILNLSLPARLQCLYTILLQLQKLHGYGYCHNDLHPGNIIADLTTLKMSMIDFGDADEMTNSMVARQDLMCLGMHAESIIFPDICSVDVAGGDKAQDKRLANGVRELLMKMRHVSGTYFSATMAVAECKMLLDAACQHEHENQNRTRSVHRLT